MIVYYITTSYLSMRSARVPDGITFPGNQIKDLKVK